MAHSKAARLNAGENFECEHCGAKYSVVFERTPVRDSDTARCSDCGNVMDEWNSTTYPIFTNILTGAVVD